LPRVEQRSGRGDQGADTGDHVEGFHEPMLDNPSGHPQPRTAKERGDILRSWKPQQRAPGNAPPIISPATLCSTWP
jgi:hypothetical protein